MLHTRFGIGPDHLNLLQDLIDTQPKQKSIEAQMLLLEAYQTSYGIYDHFNSDARNNPLKIVAMHPKENVIDLGPKINLMRRYMLYNVRQYSGKSFEDFVALPRHEVKQWLDLCEEATKKDTGKLNGLNFDLGKF